MKLNPSTFFENGATHADLAHLLGMHPSSLSTAICRGSLPFKRHRIRVGRQWIYDVDACINALKERQEASL